MLFIKARDGRLHDTTGASVGVEPDKSSLKVCLCGANGNTSVMADKLTEQQAKAIMQKIEGAIMDRAPLVEV